LYLLFDGLSISSVSVFTPRPLFTVNNFCYFVVNIIESNIMGRIKAVIFDMDGTLVNSLQDLADSANAAVAEQGFPVHSMEEVRQFVGDGVRMLIKRSLPATVSDAVVDSCLSRFREIYEVNKLNHTGPYEGMLPLLDSLRAKGILTGVLSNKYDLAVKQISSRLFPGKLDLAVGESSSIPRKPNPAGLEFSLHTLGVSASEALYVGDSDVDMLTASNAGVESVGVLWGFRSKQVLLGAGACHIVNEPSEILQLV
jgi:phosphoglycolate phosphatase